MNQRKKGRDTILPVGRCNTVFQVELMCILQSAHLAYKAGEGRHIHICSVVASCKHLEIIQI